MKFRFYITDLFAGAVVGTDDKEEAENISASEDHFVVDSETGEWVTSSGRTAVKHMNSEGE